MTCQTVSYSAAGGVGTVTLNRPDQLNGIDSIHPELIPALVQR